MTIRFARKKDREQVLGLLDELTQEVERRSGKSSKACSEEARRIFYDEELKRSDARMFVAEEGGKLIGMVDLFIVPNLRRGYHRATIENVVVTEIMRGKGVGSVLMRHILSYCKQNNMKVVKLTSGLELTEAHRFYEKHGGRFTEKLYRFDLC